jgi:hypothetical protein
LARVCTEDEDPEPLVATGTAEPEPDIELTGTAAVVCKLLPLCVER